MILEIIKMSTPKILTTQDRLDLVKEKLIEMEKHIEVLSQVQYKEKESALPSFKTQSFILYKKLEDNSLHVAKTENKNIEFISVEDFKDLVNKLPTTEKNKLARDFKELNIKPTTPVKLRKI